MTNSIDPKSREEPKIIKIEQSSWCFTISDGNSDSNEKFPHGYYINFVSGKDIYFKCYWVVHYYISSKTGFDFNIQNAKIACPIYMFFDMWKNPTCGKQIRKRTEQTDVI